MIIAITAQQSMPIVSSVLMLPQEPVQDVPFLISLMVLLYVSLAAVIVIIVLMLVLVQFVHLVIILMDQMFASSALLDMPAGLLALLAILPLAVWMDITWILMIVLVVALIILHGLTVIQHMLFHVLVLIIWMVPHYANFARVFMQTGQLALMLLTLIPVLPDHFMSMVSASLAV